MTNKLLLAAIAFGLWANAASWLVRPVQAQSDQLAGSVQQIADELRQLVEHGEKCLNPQLCQRPTKMISQPRHRQRLGASDRGQRGEAAEATTR